MVRGRPQTSRFALPEKLKIEVKTRGSPDCVPAQLGDTVFLHFVASMASQDKFFSTYMTGNPLTFEVGAGKDKVMPALNEAVESDMCEGDERDLFIPPNQGYGYQIFGDVKEDSGLVYEIKLEKIERKSQWKPVNFLKFYFTIFQKWNLHFWRENSNSQLYEKCSRFARSSPFFKVVVKHFESFIGIKDFLLSPWRLIFCDLNQICDGSLNWRRKSCFAPLALTGFWVVLFFAAVLPPWGLNMRS